MMLPEIRKYLDEVRLHLHLDAATERQVIGELYTYFQEKVAELRQKGLSEEAAVKVAITSFGRARVVARLMYEAYSKGSWPEALIASIPHLMLAGLFAAHAWNHIILAPMAFTAIVVVTIFGWWHGKPNWLYPWIGYSLVPLIIGGYESIPVLKQAVSFLLQGEGTLSNIWTMLLILVAGAFFTWLMVRTTIRVVKRDWILASLMLVPVPILGSWLFNIEQVGGLFQGTGAALHQWDMSMAVACAMLGVTSATFIRLRQRTLKIGALITVGSIVLTAVVHNLWGVAGFFSSTAIFLLMLVFLFIPALVEAKIGHGEQREDA